MIIDYGVCSFELAQHLSDNDTGKNPYKSYGCASFAHVRKSTQKPYFAGEKFILLFHIFCGFSHEIFAVEKFTQKSNTQLFCHAFIHQKKWNIGIRRQFNKNPTKIQQAVDKIRKTTFCLDIIGKTKNIKVENNLTYFVVIIGFCL